MAILQLSAVSNCWSVMCQALIPKSRACKQQQQQQQQQQDPEGLHKLLVQQSLLQQASHVSAVVLLCGLLICNTYIC